MNGIHTLDSDKGISLSIDPSAILQKDKLALLKPLSTLCSLTDRTTGRNSAINGINLIAAPVALDVEKLSPDLEK